MYACGTLAVGNHARELAAAVLAPRMTRFVPPVASWNRALSIGLLPDSIRGKYGLGWSETDQRRFERAVQRVRALRRAVPEFIALWPEARA